MTSGDQGPRRIGQWLYLKPESIETYKECHAAVWPEVLEQIKDSNICDCKFKFDVYAEVLLTRHLSHSCCYPFFLVIWFPYHHFFHIRLPNISHVDPLLVPIHCINQQHISFLHINPSSCPITYCLHHPYLRTHFHSDSIFLSLHPRPMLFASLKYVGNAFDADMARMAANPKVQEWWRMTDGMQESPVEGAVGSLEASKGNGGWWGQSEEVFRLE